MRYKRQIKFLGNKEQKELNKKTIAIVGLGALGTNSANLLSRAGVNLVLIDNDEIDITNLQRQTLFNESDIGKSKAIQALKKIKKINSDIKIKSFNKKLTKNNPNILKSDLILDCTDNLETRYLINQYSISKNIPWVHAAVIKTTGVIFNVIPKKACFNCLYKHKTGIERCEDVGILNSAASVISSIQVTQAIKILLNKNYEKNLLRFNIWNNNLEKIKVKKYSDCQMCSKKEKKDFHLKLCKTKAAYSVKPKKKLKLNIKKISKKYKTILNTPIVSVIKKGNYEIIVHSHGELIFKNLKDEDKIIKIANEIYKT